MDDNENPQLFNPINDKPETQEEIIEKPYYEDNSSPLIQNYNYSQSTNNSNNIYSDDKYNDKIQNDNKPQRLKNRIVPKVLAVFSILLILIFIADIILEIIYEFSLYIFGGGVITLIISIIYIYIVKKDMPTNNFVLGAISILGFVGLIILGGLGLDKNIEPTMKSLSVFLLGSRSKILFICIPLICIALK